ncbi:MAG: helix-turn-helix domain-containing protein [Clostridia bacterium]|nr:helix-turn-helix domain-containing protein [Clostridia bacterium]MBQ9505705.1 helix-turn-helix domain-containing protein [Clostridia bacterium]MBR5423867.1 helix-turn-helix domain-containing protein [Clostridia bacterium]
MASAKKLGQLIKAARTDAGLTQEQLARKVKNCSASDVSKAERGEKVLTNDQLKQIAKATGVTQKSLLDAAKGASASGTSSSSSSAKPKTGANTTSVKLTSTEKKLVEYYRKADSQTKKEAMSLLKGEKVETLVGNLIGSAFSALTGKKQLDTDGEDED